jgi:hypothetical protein
MHNLDIIFVSAGFFLKRCMLTDTPTLLNLAVLLVIRDCIMYFHLHLLCFPEMWLCSVCWQVLSITVSRKDDGASLAPQAHVAWYGSSTSSLMPCDQLSPFLETFKVFMLLFLLQNLEHISGFIVRENVSSIKNAGIHKIQILCLIQ